MEKVVTGELNSKIGFYIGDLCYVLEDEIYSNVWGDKYKFKNGIIPVGSTKFVVSNTYIGDGCYHDKEDNSYYVDSGTISCVPLELVHHDKIRKIENGELGKVFEIPGTTQCNFCEGRFLVILPDGSNVYIDTQDSDEPEYD